MHVPGRGGSAYNGIFGETDVTVVAGFAQQLVLERLPAGLVIDGARDFDGRLYIIVSGKVQQGSDVLVADTEALKAVCRNGGGPMSDVA
ncbi:hypothetical protein [Mycobacterium simiae]|uniref:hypothetical protein n=1 Tax=Mycobacterium simiae TaxID=1784 RepID=UPI00111C1BCA|nr:hypothetical protein [Mycobacterium simiae]